MLNIRANSFVAAVSSFIQLFLLLSGTSVAIAKEYVLFATGSDGLAHPVANYNEIVGALRGGDVVTFSDGKSFQLVKDLQNGRGAVSRVFSIRSPRGSALKLPQQSNSLQLDMINRSIDGYGALQEAGISTVSIQGSKRGEYLVVNQIKPGFTTADDFFRDSGRFSEGDRRKMINRLVDFGKTTAYFKHIGDFGLSQIVYVPSEERWVLLDWTAGHVTIHPNSKPSNSFEHFFDPVLKDLTGPARNRVVLVQKKIFAAVQTEQSRIQSSPLMLDRLKKIERKIVAHSHLKNASVIMQCFDFQMNQSFDF